MVKFWNMSHSNTCINVACPAAEKLKICVLDLRYRWELDVTPCYSVLYVSYDFVHAGNHKNFLTLSRQEALILNYVSQGTELLVVILKLINNAVHCNQHGWLATEN